VPALLSERVVWDASQALWARGMYAGHIGVRQYFRTIGQVWDGLRLMDYTIEAAGPGRYCVQGRLRGLAGSRTQIPQWRQHARGPIATVVR